MAHTVNTDCVGALSGKTLGHRFADRASRAVDDTPCRRIAVPARRPVLPAVVSSRRPLEERQRDTTAYADCRGRSTRQIVNELSSPHIRCKNIWEPYSTSSASEADANSSAPSSAHHTAHTRSVSAQQLADPDIGHSTSLSPPDQTGLASSV